MSYQCQRPSTSSIFENNWCGARAYSRVGVARLALTCWLLVATQCFLGCDTTGSVTTPASTKATNGEAQSSATTESPAQADGSAGKVQPSGEQKSSGDPAQTKTTSTKRKEAPAQLVSFDDLNLGMPVDSKFRNVMLEFNGGVVKEHFGKRIIVAGYMDSTDVMTGVKEFILLRNLECKFGPGGQADHLIRVYMAENETTSFTDQTVYVEGELTLNPFPEDPQKPYTWSIYDMLDAKVSTRRPSR